MPCFYCPTRRLRTFPFESWMKIVGLSFHVFMELKMNLRRDKQTGNLALGLESAHHICMISGFIVGAVIEILVHHGAPFPKKTEYMFNLLAFLIQLLIMAGHDFEGLEATVHKLWTVLIGLTVLAAACEVYDSDNIWTVYSRICFFLAQGSWMMQMAFVLWPHTSNPRFIWTNTHASHVWLNIYLMLHLVVAACTLMGQYMCVVYAVKTLDRFYSRYELDLGEIDAKAVPVRFPVYDNQEMSRRNNRSDHSKEYSILLNSEDNEENEN